MSNEFYKMLAVTKEAMKASPKSSWVKNELANEAVLRAQESIATGRRNNKAIQDMMDLISGIQNYAIWNINKQGVIRKAFELERLRHNGTKAGRAASFATDLDDVISTFWEHVFKYLPRATATGENVPVRVVDGQYDDDTEFDENTSTAGLQFVQRSTKCNPVHYLRNMGIMGVRNLINKSYRRNIVMVCDDCGQGSSVSTTEESSDKCPKCTSDDVGKYWPDGNSSYRSRKARKCNECNHIWLRQFTRKCYKCNSENVRTESRIQNGEDSIFQAPSGEDSAETLLVANELNQNIDTLIGKLYNFLPSDPRDPKVVSRTKDVFNILTRPEFSKDMCGKCVAKAPMVCDEKCGLTNCIHGKAPDPKISCGEPSFSLDKCINFSKKIGEYHGCSASLAARRVKKVREYVKRYIVKHAASEQCKVVAGLMAKLDV